MASLYVTFPDHNQPISITPRLSDDLPAHVKGTAYWQQQVWSCPACYFVNHENHSLQPVELINNQWYGLYILNNHWATQTSLLVSTPDVVGLGQYQPPSSTQIIVRPQSCRSFCAPSPSSSSSRSSTASAHTASSTGSNAPMSPAVQALPPCYVLVECSARHELDGYDSIALHVVLEAYASDTLWELLVCGHMDGTGLWGRGRYPRCTRCSGGICMFRASRLDWHENSDLRSKSVTGTT